MKTYQIVTYLLLCVVIVGCKAGSGTVEPKVVDFDLSYQTGPSIRPDSELQVWIKNQTSECISFPSDFDIKIFLNLDNQLIEVRNLVTYLGDEPIMVSPRGEIFSQRLVYAQPDVAGLNITSPVDSFVLITGHLCSEDETTVEKKIPFVISP